MNSLRSLQIEIQLLTVAEVDHPPLRRLEIHVIFARQNGYQFVHQDIPPIIHQFAGKRFDASAAIDGAGGGNRDGCPTIFANVFRRRMAKRFGLKNGWACGRKMARFKATAVGVWP
jgi:hypothetical protein